MVKTDSNFHKSSQFKPNDAKEPSDAHDEYKSACYKVNHSSDQIPKYSIKQSSRTSHDSPIEGGAEHQQNPNRN